MPRVYHPTPTAINSGEPAFMIEIEAIAAA
jgi:hypothetical protein